MREEVGARVLSSEHDVLHIGRGGGLRAVWTVAAALRPDLNLPVTLLEAVLKRESSFVTFVHFQPQMCLKLKNNFRSP